MAACKSAPKKITLQSELRRLRLSLGLSARALATRVGIDVAWISRVESGHSCRLETLRLIAQGLAVSKPAWEALKQLWLQHQDSECAPGPAPARKR